MVLLFVTQLCYSQQKTTTVESLSKKDSTSTSYQAKEKEERFITLTNSPGISYEELNGNGNYQLSGRKILRKSIRVQECNETGTVVVSIEVNRDGKVIKAVPGVRGTTNTKKCLLDPAKAAALATKFNADPKAPSKQIGKIVYKFSLSD